MSNAHDTGDNPLVSIVIATRERPEVLRRCLACVFAQDYSHFEVIVIDNSPDEQSANVITNFPLTRYIRGNSKSDNVAALRNEALSCAEGVIVAFIDDDTLVKHGWLSAMILAFQDDSVGGVTGRIVEEHTPVENSRDIGRLSPARDMEIGSGFNNIFPQPVEVDYIPGCNLGLRRSVLDQVGGFDPVMHYAREDQEICLRVRSAGYRLLFWPGVEVYHLQAPRATTAVQRASRDYRSRFVNCRSLAYLFVRHFGPRIDFAYLSLFRLPKADLGVALGSPSLHNIGMPFVTVLGILAGFFWALMARCKLHGAPQIIRM